MFINMSGDYQNNLPDPEVVARAAAEAPAPRVLEDYNQAIEILRDKKFTFREIAEWLNKKFNIQADHNSVWRAYTKHMDDYGAHLEARADEELERDEAIETAQCNGASEAVSHTPVQVIESAVKTAPPSKVKRKRQRRQ